MDDLTLTYSHNVIEHLGLKLYQNRPTRVVAELVSNSWDADSDSSWVEMAMPEQGERWVGVYDIGHGMTREELANQYLVIGAPKRKSPVDTSRKGRKLMGRKGIGKLAPFGIAETVELITAAQNGDGVVVHWLRLCLSDIKGTKENGGTASYQPALVLDGGTLEELVDMDDPTGCVASFAGQILESDDNTGTLVLLRDLSINRAISESRLVASMGRRFTSTLDRGFTVFVNGKAVESANSLPKFEYRIPEMGMTAESIDGKEVRFWVGFVEEASWPQDEAGVGVYSHGKICQDRPFTFGVKGKEIFTRYMYAVVEADWLDEQDEDIISTDRTALNWDAEAAVPLHEWGAKKVRSWVGNFEKWRKGDEKRRNKKRVEKGIKDKTLPSITEEEQDQVAELLAEITPSLGKDEETKDRLADAVATAWVQEPMRALVKEVWSELGKEDASVPGAFAGLVEKLIAYSIPESLNLAVVFAQRAFALSKLYEFVHVGKEVDLQKLIEKFPWIIEPDSAYLTANQTLRSVVTKAEKEGLIPSGRTKNVAGTPDDNKPDFVFLASPDNERIVVVELKNPQVDLTLDNREQLAGYLTFLEAHYPKAELRGYLVGRAPGEMRVPRDDMDVVPWTDVMKRSRARHVAFLAAMLSTASRAEDARVEQVREFAGEETWELLAKLAESNPGLKDLMAAFEGYQAKEPEAEGDKVDGVAPGADDPEKDATEKNGE